MINIIYPFCSLGGMLGTIYGFSYGISKVKNDIIKAFTKINKNDHRVIASTFIIRPKDIIFYTSIGFFYGVLWPTYPLYKFYIKKF